MDSVAQSRKLNPRVTVRMSRCSISVMRTVSRISDWVYSIKTEVGGQKSAIGLCLLTSDLRSLTSAFLSHYFAEHQEDDEYDEQGQGHEHKAETWIVRSFLEHYGRDLTNFLDALNVVGKCFSRSCRSAMQFVTSRLVLGRF